MRKSICIILIIILCLSLITGCSTKKDEQKETVKTETVNINVSALKGPTAMGMVKLMSDSEEGKTENNQYNFTISSVIDEITPKIVQGEVDIAAVPANLAAVLYKNTGGKISVLAINTLGVLYIMENGNAVNSVEDLKGKTIYASGKGATPEYALNYMLEANGIDPAKDVTIEYKSEHAECMTALLTNENAIAMLPQPFVTTAMSKSDSVRIAIDLTKEWEKQENEEGNKSTLITGVVIARNDFIEKNPEAISSFMSQYKESVTFVNKNIDDAAALIGKYDIFTAEIAKKALPYCNITFIEGDQMQEKLNGYLGILFKQNPASVGGAIPDENFYYKR